MRFFRFTLLLLLFAGLSQTATAQDYKSAVGLRLGYPWSVSYKTFLGGSNKAVEVYAGYRGFTGYNWFSVNGAYLVHRDIDSVDGLQWYFGGGAGAQFWGYDVENDFTSGTFSISGYLGLEYTFEDAPIAITADWVPTYFLGSNIGFGFNSFGADYGALGVRYVLGR